MSTVLVEVRGGIADVTHGDGDVIVIDWDNEIDYERAYALINELLMSSLDGPTQIAYIKDVCDRFNGIKET